MRGAALFLLLAALAACPRTASQKAQLPPGFKVMGSQGLDAAKQQELLAHLASQIPADGGEGSGGFSERSSVRELVKHAEGRGCTEAEVDAAMDADSPKQALLALLRRLEDAADGLAELSVRALVDKAEEENCGDEAAVDAAMDADEPKQAFASLLRECRRAATARRQDEPVCAGEDRSLDLWAADSVERVWVVPPGKQEAPQLFEVLPGLRVLSSPGSGWLPTDTDCKDWIPIGAASHLPVSAYKCDYAVEVGETMLAKWWRRFGDQVHQAFGVERCEHRSYDNGHFTKSKHYTTVGNRELEPDDRKCSRSLCVFC